MKEITGEMIKDFKIKELGYDFMGYNFRNPSDLSFHHLIVAKRNCPSLGLGDGYMKWNGAVLIQRSSHEYLHLIERLEKDLFWMITSEMIDENVKGYIDKANLKRIRDLLLCFEHDHRNDEDKKGRRLIRKIYTTNRIPL